MKTKNLLALLQKAIDQDASLADYDIEIDSEFDDTSRLAIYKDRKLMLILCEESFIPKGVKIISL